MTKVDKGMADEETDGLVAQRRWESLHLLVERVVVLTTSIYRVLVTLMRRWVVSGQESNLHNVSPLASEPQDT